jgi:hypothetical protein
MSLKIFSTDWLIKIKELIGLTSIQSDLSAFSLTQDGYQRLPNGLIIQWGQTVVTGGSGGFSDTFPIPFPNAVFTCVANPVNDNGAVAITTKNLTGLAGTSSDLTSNAANGIVITWIALGY